ncbi:MAG: diguanylate cyclase, partial [Gaiellales bacterium]
MTAERESTERVVIVDDSRLMLEIARDALADRLEVECCASGEEALEALGRRPADLVLSDIEMPGISGLDLLERVLREHPGTDFAVMTAHASVDSAIRALRMGAVDYLVKPVQPETLVVLVDRILAQRRLIRENGWLRDTLTTLKSCRTLTQCLDPSELYSVTLDLLLETLQRLRGLVLYSRGPIPISDGVVFRGFDEHHIHRLRDALVGEKAVDVEVISEVGVVAESQLHDVLRAHEIGAEPALVVPLSGRESESGAIWIFEGGRPFTASELERVQLISGHAGLALLNAERYNHAKERAFIDDVTEVYNARYLIQATEREMQRAERYGKRLTVLFLDLDHFKLVNDQYGHLVGSRVLRQLSEILTACIRQVDTLARYGGDEFTILLIDTDHEIGLAVADRIRRTVAVTSPTKASIPQ